MQRLAILIPVLKRPHNVKPVLDAFLENTPPPHDVFMICDPWDTDEIKAVKEDGRAELMIFTGTYGQKINFGVAHTDHELVFLAADDLRAQPGWLDAAKQKLEEGFEVVGINDLLDANRRRVEHATHFLMTRAYAELPTFDGKRGPLAEIYHHWCCDDELMATARHRNAYAYAKDAHVKHLHWLNNSAPDDETYRRGRSYERNDRRTFHRRMQALEDQILATKLSNFSVVVATCGQDSWHELALARAIPSAEAQKVSVIPVHGYNTLAAARNAGLAQVETEFVIFLDADDELEPGYVTAMAEGSADLRGPRVRMMRDGKVVKRGLYMPRIGHPDHRNHECSGECLKYGNWLVIGTAARTDLVREVGGFGEEAIYEDWALWLRMWKAGATVEAIPKAIYRQHLRRDSRNHNGEAYEHREEWHMRIVTSILGEVPA